MLIVWPEGSGCVQREEDLIPLKRLGTVEYYGTPPRDKQELICRLENAHVVFLDYSVMDAEVLEKCRNLQFICFLGIGYQNCIDVEMATRKGVTVAYTPGYGATSVAEFTLGMILALARHIAFAYLSTRDGAWESSRFTGVELRGRNLGIVGFGPIGTEMARLGASIGMKTLAWTRAPSPARAEYGVRFVSLEQLFESSDVVSIHLNYNNETERLISSELLQLMKPSAYFVNTARAKIVDSDALYQLLKDRKIAGAALDVHEEEPLPKDCRFLTLPNVLISPHIGYNTVEAGQNMLRIAIATLEAYSKGEKLHVVN